jgi:hypothetical protein
MGRPIVNAYLANLVRRGAGIAPEMAPRRQPAPALHGVLSAAGGLGAPGGASDPASLADLGPPGDLETSGGLGQGMAGDSGDPGGQGFAVPSPGSRDAAALASLAPASRPLASSMLLPQTSAPRPRHPAPTSPRAAGTRSPSLPVTDSLPAPLLGPSPMLPPLDGLAAASGTVPAGSPATTAAAWAISREPPTRFLAPNGVGAARFGSAADVETAAAAAAATGAALPRSAAWLVPRSAADAAAFLPPAHLAAPGPRAAPADDETRIEVRIGRIELQAAPPPPAPAPARAARRGFEEHAAARRCLDRRWY